MEYYSYVSGIFGNSWGFESTQTVSDFDYMLQTINIISRFQNLAFEKHVRSQALQKHVNADECELQSQPYLHNIWENNRNVYEKKSAQLSLFMTDSTEIFRILMMSVQDFL